MSQKYSLVLIMLLSAVVFWVWFDLNETQAPADSKVAGQLLEEMRLLNANLAKLKPQISPAIYSPADDATVSTASLEQLRRLIREELHAAESQSRGTTHPAVDYTLADSSPAQQAEAAEVSTAIVDSFIASGMLSESQRTRLGELSPHIDEDVKRELTHRIVMAINRQELKPGEPLELPF